MGEMETKRTASFVLKDPTKKSEKKRQKERGRIVFTKFRVFTEPSFLEFIAGGMQVGLMVAVDFTLSNLHPSDPRSLHSTSGGPNQYQQAIRLSSWAGCVLFFFYFCSFFYFRSIGDILQS